MPHTPADSPLGKHTAYVDQYAPDLLYPIARAPLRAQLGISGQPRFVGADGWTAYELSWLNPRGKPQVALARLSVPCDSSHIIESKSLKLYLGSYSGSRFDSAEQVRQRLQDDLSAAAWHGQQPRQRVSVQLIGPDDFARESVRELAGLSIDRLDVDCQHYGPPAPDLLQAALHEQPVTEVLCTQLLKSNCPVTGQPDWGSLQVAYSGPQIDQASLLRYIVSYRQHNDFHEHCVERIFCDIWARCQPIKLSVQARYTRRGGLDINPWRSSYPSAPPEAVRTARQ